MTSTVFQQFVRTHSPLLTQEMERYFAERKAAVSPDLPYFQESVDSIAEFVLRGGKNIRSLLVVLGARLAGYERGSAAPDPLYKAAAAIELFHKHILNIDDMADRDEKRYGGPTLWVKYTQDFAERKWSEAAHHGRSFSEIAGTLLGSYAFEMMRTSQFPAEVRLQAMEVMNQVMYWDTVAGWQIHYYQNHLPLSQAREAEFIKGLELVTAKYTFVAPLKVGLILAERLSPEIWEPLEEYAKQVGTAFQMHDDILGLFGNPDETGKPVGNDVREGKKTLLLQKAYQNLSGEDQKFLENVCGTNLSSDELKRVQDLVMQSGSLAYSQQLAKKSVEKGVVALESLRSLVQKNGRAEELEVLKELARYIIERKV